MTKGKELYPYAYLCYAYAITYFHPHKEIDRQILNQNPGIAISRYEEFKNQTVIQFLTDLEYF